MKGVIWWSFGPSISGSYSTTRIKKIGARLEAFGKRVPDRKLYSPFIIAGPAQWTDTWGGVRHAEAGELRPHIGQDVFCDTGDAVLALEAGTVEFTTDPLGGLVAKLHRPRGGYFYYAHLSRWNSKRFSTGDAVKAGDVIGFCGKSGNAATTPPHVHFGLNMGGMVNPMPVLVDHLRAAQNRALKKLARIRKDLLGGTMLTRTKRMYGERFLPNLSTITCVANPDPMWLATFGGEELVSLLDADSAGCAGV
jgi:hypothetical protein